MVTIYLTIKTNTLNGTILYSSEKNFGQQFLHLFLLEGRPTVKYGCGNSQNILTLSANYSINTNVFIPITIRMKAQTQKARLGMGKEGAKRSLCDSEEVFTCLFPSLKHQDDNTRFLLFRLL
nr:protein eyes shut homolog [Equus asinus]